MILLVITGLFCSIAYFILMRHYRRLWMSLPESVDMDYPPLSLIIPFRNEEKHMDSLCRSLNQLDYPVSNLQIIFVDDHSEDFSGEVIKQAGLKYEFRILPLSDTSGKKAAIKEAWQYVNTDIIVHTDADCRFGKDWLGLMAGMFREERVQFVSGPVQFIEKESFFDRITALDFSGLIAIGAAHIAWNRPLMCNGANLAYRKKILEQVNILEAKTSGDDVFLMQSIHHQYKNGVMFCKNRAAMVQTEGPESVSAFWQQRLRWAGKNGTQLIPLNLFILIFIWLYNLLILMALFTFSKIGLTLALYQILIKALAEFFFFDKTASFFQAQKWQGDLFLGQFFHVIYMSVLPLVSKFTGFTWKGRRHRH